MPSILRIGEFEVEDNISPEMAAIYKRELQNGFSLRDAITRAGIKIIAVHQAVTYASDWSPRDRTLEIQRILNTEGDDPSWWAENYPDDYALALSENEAGKRNALVHGRRNNQAAENVPGGYYGAGHTGIGSVTIGAATKTARPSVDNYGIPSVPTVAAPSLTISAGDASGPPPGWFYDYTNREAGTGRWRDSSGTEWPGTPNDAPWLVVGGAVPEGWYWDAYDRTAGTGRWRDPSGGEVAGSFYDRPWQRGTTPPLLVSSARSRASELLAVDVNDAAAVGNDPAVGISGRAIFIAGMLLLMYMVLRRKRFA